jgi:hypothetical protein
VEPLAPSQVPCAKEVADDDAYNMDFISNTNTQVVGKIPDIAPQGTLNRRLSTATSLVPQIPPSMPKEASRKNPKVPSQKSNALQLDTETIVENQAAPQQEPVPNEMACAADSSVGKTTNDQALVPNVEEGDPRKGVADQDSAPREGQRGMAIVRAWSRERGAGSGDFLF